MYNHMDMYIVVVHGYGYNKIGNIVMNSPKKVWKSNAAKLQRLSIINKTYAFCNEDICPVINDKNNVKYTETRFNDVKCGDFPEKLYVSIDESCNLKCKSCRNDYYNATGKELKFRKKLANKLIKSNWCNNAKKLTIAGQGEVMYSKIYLDMIFNSKITKRESIEIHTNGTLLDKEKLDKLISIYNSIYIYVSIDAATEETYKKLRRWKF